MSSYMRIVYFGRKFYKCFYCDYVFVFRGNLNMYLKGMYFYIRQYFCIICKVVFKIFGVLIGYIKRVYEGWKLFN